MMPEPEEQTAPVTICPPIRLTKKQADFIVAWLERQEAARDRREAEETDGGEGSEDGRGGADQ